MRRPHDSNDRYSALKNNERIMDRPGRLVAYAIVHNRKVNEKIHVVDEMLQKNFNCLLDAFAKVKPGRAALIIKESCLADKIGLIYSHRETSPFEHGEEAIRFLTKLYLHAVSKTTNDIGTKTFKSDSYKSITPLFSKVGIIKSRYFADVSKRKRKKGESSNLPAAFTDELTEHKINDV